MPSTAAPTCVSFFVPGLPAPGGSKRSFVSKGTGKVVVLDDCARNKDWRSVVALAARREMGGRDPLRGPLRMTLNFFLPRPRGHFGTGRNAGLVRPKAPAFPTTKPDTTKLVRSTEDAMLLICYEDDAQIVRQQASKDYGSSPGVYVLIEPAAPEV